MTDDFFHMPLTRCLRCGHKLDASSSLETDERGPEPGDATLCMNCGHIHIFTDDMKLREPSAAELHELKDDPAVADVREIVANYQRLRKTTQ